MDYGPARDAPNPLQRWAARGVVQGAVAFTLTLGMPVVLVLLASGPQPRWVIPVLVGGLFVFSLAAAWVNSPNVEDPGAEVVPYLPWFSRSQKG